MNTITDTTKKFAKGLFNPDNKLSLIPNWLSFSRVIGGLAIPVMAYTNAPISLFFGSISFLAFSDFLDGFTARVIAKEETKEGAMLDAVSDKIFSLLLIIGILPTLPIFIINGALEGTIAAINAKLLANGGEPKSNILGKIKIWPLSIALALGYLGIVAQNLNLVTISSNTLLTISSAIGLGTIPLQIVNIKQYFNQYQSQKEKNKNQNTQPKQQLTNEKQYTKNKQLNPKPKLSLTPNNHQAIVYELTKPFSKAETEYKTYTKKAPISHKTN